MRAENVAKSKIISHGKKGIAMEETNDQKMPPKRSLLRPLMTSVQGEKP